ncbi:MAG TPA: hypothetical protein VFI42_19730, partial [Thermomicrobiaceae bacterium]|nr:hypothetical protein [Thermomicrobiaceae bacterium]
MAPVRWMAACASRRAFLAGAAGLLATTLAGCGVRESAAGSARLWVPPWAGTPGATPIEAVPRTPKAELFGVAGNAFPWEPDFPAFARLLAASQVGWARVELRWEGVEPNPGNWTWRIYDELVDAYGQLGIQQLGLLCYSVAWAAGQSGPRPVFGPPVDLDAWEGYVQAVVRRYHDRIHAWEIWNEPDAPIFWNNQDGGDPQVYLTLLERAARVIKAIDHSATVLNGGVTGTERGANFLKALLDLGGGKYLDGIALHGYVPNGYIDDPWFRTAVWPLLAGMVTRSGKRLWITEVGWSSGADGGASAGSEAAQASLLARHLPLLFNLPNLEHIFVFQFKDPNDTPNSFGLVRADATPKPAYSVLRTYAEVLRGLGFQQRVPRSGEVWDVRFGGPGRVV